MFEVALAPVAHMNLRFPRDSEHTIRIDGNAVEDGVFGKIEIAD